MKDKSEQNNKEKINSPEKDILTTVGDLAWKVDLDVDSINADEMFKDAPIAGSAGVEC